MKHTATAILLLALIVAIALPALAAEELGVVYGGGLHLRTAPSLEAEIINTYPSGTHVQVTAVEGSWYAVTVEDGQKGYMEADYVYITSVGIIDNGDAYVNLRTSPSRDASIIGEYASGTQVTLLSEDTEGWAYVDIDGVWGYMDLEFIKPLPLGSDILTTPAPQAGGDSSLATNGENDVVQQIGQSESAISSTELLSYAVYYPVLGIDAADVAIRTWVFNTLADAEQTAQEAGEGAGLEITVQYDSYLINNRYIGVLETGFFDGHIFANPSDLIYTVNVDQLTGSLLTYEEIFQPAQLSTLLELLRDRVLSLEEGAFDDLTIDETWLTNALLKPEGVAIILPKSEYLPSVLGTQSFVITYEELIAENLLALDIPADASPQDVVETETTLEGGAKASSSVASAANGAGATFFVGGNRLANYRDATTHIAAAKNGVWGLNPQPPEAVP